MDLKNDRIELQLRPLQLADYETVLTWSKDEEFCHANQWDLHRDAKEIKSWWARCVENRAENFIRLGIELEGKLIGYSDVVNICNNSAELGIAIGESKLWGKGLGRIAMEQTLQYAYKNLNITTFTAETHEANMRSRNMLKKLGFKEVSQIGSDMYRGQLNKLIQFQLNIQSLSLR